MGDKESQLLIRTDDDITIIQFLDKNILDESSIQKIGDEVSAIIEKASVPKLLISFEKVEHLSSAALGALIMINNKIRQRDGQLRLSNIGPHIYEVFTITKLDKLFRIHKTTEDACKKFK